MKLFSSIFLILAIAVFGYGQSASKILKRAEKALGATKQLTARRSWQRSGRITRMNDTASGHYSLTTRSPNLLNERYDLNGFESESGFNGRSAWVRDSRDGLRTLTGDASLTLQTEAVIRNSLWLNYRSDKWKAVLGKSANINGKMTDPVVFTTSQNVTIKIYFDAASSLPIREEIISGDARFICDLADYRDVGGLKQPFSYHVTTGGEQFDIEIDDIKKDVATARTEFDFPVISGQALPDVPKLLDELRANEDKVEALLDTYSYIQKSTSRELGKDGVLRDKASETNQLSFYKGYRIQRLIEKNDKPLSSDDQADEDKKTAKRVAEIEKLIAAKGKNDEQKGPPSEESRKISIAEVLRASKLTNPRRERFRGRDMIVFDFEPDPAFDYKNAKSMLKFFGKTAGVIWVDEADKQVARVEASLVDSYNVGGGIVAKLKKGATFTLDQQRVNDEIWLPSQADINLSVRVLLVKGIELDQVIRSYDYRKFTTEVQDASVNDPPKQDH